MALASELAATDKMSVEQMIDAILEGRADTVERSGGPLADKVLRLAALGTQDAETQLKRWVDMSLTANNSVRQVAEMTRSVREVDGRTQSIAAAVEEMSSTVDSINAAAETAASEAQEAEQVASVGRDAASEAVSSMGSVFQVVSDAVAKVETLSEASDKIGEITSTIEAIAKQTNLLALNATIEAARAGEAGKGFAVVANEVKNLASQTAKATEDIRSRIQSLRSEMATIVEVMQSGSEKVSAGRTAIESTGAEMESLAARVSSVTGRMSDISGILAEQRAATREIAEGIGVISEMSSDNVRAIDGTIETLEATAPIIAQSIDAYVKAGTPNATIHAAKSDHLIWMRRLAQMLAGRAQLNPSELADHHSCRLGKWYDQQKDPRLTGHQAWRDLLEPHKQVHKSGIAAAEAYKRGDLETAIAHVAEAGEASKDVLRHLNTLSEFMGRVA